MKTNHLNEEERKKSRQDELSDIEENHTRGKVKEKDIISMDDERDEHPPAASIMDHPQDEQQYDPHPRSTEK